MYPLYSDMFAMTHQPRGKRIVGHGNTDLTLVDIPAAPLQLAEEAVPGLPAGHVYLHVAGDPRARLLPSHGNTYGKEAGLGHNAYLPGQPIRTETQHCNLERCWYGYVWIKTTAEDGGVCYKHYYAATEGRSHPATTLYMGRDGANIILQAEPHYWRQSVDLRARVLAAEARIRELEARQPEPEPVAAPAPAPVRNPDLAPLSVLPRGTVIFYDQKRKDKTFHAIYQGETVEGADGVSYTSLSTWLKNALGYQAANGWEGTYVMLDGKAVRLQKLRAAAAGGGGK